MGDSCDWCCGARGARLGLTLLAGLLLRPSFTVCDTIAVPVEGLERAARVRTPDGHPLFMLCDVQWLSRPGEPAIPWRVVTLCLPEDAERAGGGVSVRGTPFEAIDGTWEVPPTPPMEAGRGHAVAADPFDADPVVYAHPVRRGRGR